MFQFPNLNQIKIQGPFWSADAAVVKMDTTAAQVPLPLGEFTSSTLTAVSPFERKFVNDSVSSPSIAPAPSTLPDDTLGKPVLHSAGAALSVAEFSYPGSAAWSAYTVSGRVRVSQPNGVVGIVIFSRVGQGSGAFRLLRFDVGKNIRLLQFTPANQDPNPDATSQAHFLVNTWFQFVIQVSAPDASGNRTLQAKVFLDGIPAPANFELRTRIAAAEAGSLGVMVNGPGEKFFADLKVQFDARPSDTQLLRRLLAERPVPGVAAQGNVILALCKVKAVNVGTFAWQNTNLGGGIFPPTEFHVVEADIRDGLRNGKLILLVLRFDAGSPAAALPCLAGEIHLSGDFTPLANARAALYLKLGLADQGGNLSVHSGGLSIEGAATLPWQSAAVPGAYLLSQDPGAASFRMVVEQARLTSSERGALTQAWRGFSLQVNPALPLIRAGAAPQAWATLEAQDPLSVPPVFWTWSSAPWVVSDPPLLNVEKGKLSLILSDQQPYGISPAPTSLARIVPDFIRISAPAGGLQIDFQPGPSSSTSGPVLNYTFGSGTETISLRQVELAYDPVETPRALRAQQGIPAPVWTKGIPLDSPLLWAFMPLEDGWAQLPVPNLTEQVYLDAALFRPGDAPDPSGLIQGGVSFGNGIAIPPVENPWSLTLLDGAGFTGTWTLAGAAGQMRTSKVNLNVLSPKVVLDGLCWFSTGKPTVEDALPNLDNWVSGLQSVSLQTVSRSPSTAGQPPQPDDLFPSLMTFNVAEVQFSRRSNVSPPDAGLSAYRLAYQVDPVELQAMLQAKVLPGPDPRQLPSGIFAANPPLVWRRHKALPMIQALPMTQSQVPPNSPNASRQLMPFVPPVTPAPAGQTALPDGWTFSVPASSVSAAAQFPALQHQLSDGSLADDFHAAPEWKSDLPIASLSLPGLFLDPAGAHFYRYDLPYTDQIQALAQTTSDPSSAQDQTQVPLLREDLAAYWSRLSSQANLAAMDAVVEGPAGAGGALVLDHLVEPAGTLSPSSTVSFDSYPGSLTVNGVASQGDDALQGVSIAPAAGTAFPITAGSMAAVTQTGGSSPVAFRDQRGLSRQATRGTTLLRTAVADAVTNIDLVSMLGPITLDAGLHWQFWCKDLPTATGTNRFSRADARSTAAADVNDPEARSRDQNFKNGYEWRLAQANATATAPGFLPLCGLQFYPLTLEAVEFSGDALSAVRIAGRLQLPLAGAGEMTQFPNAVMLTFTPTASGALGLSNAALISAMGQWPLAPGGPQLFWKDISYDATTQILKLNTVAAHFMLAGEPWSIGGMNAAFSSTTSATTLNATPAPSGASVGIQATSLSVTVSPGTGIHGALLGVSAKVGTPDRNAFSAGFAIDLLDPSKLTWTDGQLFGAMKLDVRAGVSTFCPQALQFSWSRFSPDPGRALQLLPGMNIAANRDVPGYAILAFDVIAAVPASDLFQTSLPSFQVATAFLEALIQCSWGSFLQSPASPGPTFSQVFGSSAGEIAFGYTLQVNNGVPSESSLFNGVLEVKNLISWPRAMAFDSQAATLTLPAAGTALNHTRHSMRVLLNQHTIGQDLLKAGTGDILFVIDPAKTWQFLAVVEHQLIDVAPQSLTANSFTGQLTNDVRWTAVQEVRLLSPSAFQVFLASLDGEAAGDPSGGLVRRASGYLQPELRAALNDALAALGSDILIVEASAAHWIASRSAGAPPAITLQFLPNGCQQAIPSSPADYSPDLSLGVRWMPVATPFLGRLQPVDPDAGLPQANLLQVDPVVRLGVTSPPDRRVLALCHWAAGTSSVSLTVSAFDASPDRAFPLLDPASLAESFFRIQNPPQEALPAAPGSVMASLPDTPARSSRPTALLAAFSNLRLKPPDFPPVPGEESGPVVWRKNSLLLTEAASVLDLGSVPPYGWHIIGAQFIAAGLRGSALSSPQRHSAATLIPVAGSAAGQGQVVLSVVASPYQGLEFLEPPPGASLKLVDAELLCLDPVSNRLLPVADRLWADDSLVDSWASETRKRLSPESPVGVLRMREVKAADSSATLVVQYSFRLLPVDDAAGMLASQATALRSEVTGLLFREAQFGGMAMPVGTQAFELAPPQITGVQPLYLTAPGILPADAAGHGWSGLRISVQCSDRNHGVVPDAASPKTLWWHAPEHAVQFQPAAAGLPLVFRAPAILSLRPALANPPMPAPDVSDWMPILPGSLHYALTGNRPGGMLALRHHLIRQSGQDVLAGGSIPVQHRVPRPVPLAPNQASGDTALQTWAGAFDPLTNARVGSSPADEVYFASLPASGLRLTLTTPALPLIDSSWDGTVVFGIVNHGAPTPWDLAGWLTSRELV